MSGLLWLMIGSGISGLSIVSQWWAIKKLEPHAKAGIMWLFTVGFLLRLSLAGVCFFFALKQGVISAILILVGMLICRWGILVWINSRSIAMKTGGVL